MAATELPVAKAATSPHAPTALPISRNRRCGAGAIAGAGDRRNPGRRVRRRLSTGARGRYALSSSGGADVDHGNQMGTDSRHGRHADPGEPRSRRYFARTDLYGADLLGAGGAELWPCDANLRRPAQCCDGSRPRDRGQESARDPRGKAHAEQSLGGSRSCAARRIRRAAKTDRRAEPDRGGSRQSRKACAAICGPLIVAPLFLGIISGERRRTHAEVAERSSRIAGGLQRLGVQQGASVCILMRNDIAFIESAYAVALLGAYAVPVNWHFKPEEIAYVLKDSGTRVLIAHADMLHRLRDV